MRKTKQREVILRVLGTHMDHPSADIIYEEVRKHLPKISLGTVYRNLELMSEAGSIMKLETGGSVKRFDPVVSPHPHFRCIKCGAIEDVPYDEKNVLFSGNTDNWAHGRVIQKLNIEYTGLCANCNGNSPS